MKIVTKYVAFDGVLHSTEAECRAYETKLAHVRLANLTIEQIEAALEGADPDLADCIEQIGAKLGRARRERGELKRERGHKGAQPDPTPPRSDASSETEAGSAQPSSDVQADEAA